MRIIKYENAVLIDKGDPKTLLDSGVYEESGSYHICESREVFPERGPLRAGTHSEKPHIIIRGKHEPNGRELLEQTVRDYNAQEEKSLQGLKDALKIRLPSARIYDTHEEDMNGEAPLVVKNIRKILEDFNIQ